MEAILVFLDGTICDTRHRDPLYGTRAFYSDEEILADLPTKGSVACMRELSQRYTLLYIGARLPEYRDITEQWMRREGFPEGEIFLGETQEERLKIVARLRGSYPFKAGIGDRWDDNELHLLLGCMSIILREYEPNWETVRTYIR